MNRKQFLFFFIFTFLLKNFLFINAEVFKVSTADGFRYRAARYNQGTYSFQINDQYQWNADSLVGINSESDSYEFGGSGNITGGNASLNYFIFDTSILPINPRDFVAKAWLEIPTLETLGVDKPQYCVTVSHFSASQIITVKNPDFFLSQNADFKKNYFDNLTWKHGCASETDFIESNEKIVIEINIDGINAIENKRKKGLFHIVFRGLMPTLPYYDIVIQNFTYFHSEKKYATQPVELYLVVSTPTPAPLSVSLGGPSFIQKYSGILSFWKTKMNELLSLSQDMSQWFKTLQ